MKLYIAVLDEVPENMVPVLVAHAVLGAHLEFSRRYISDNEHKFSPYAKYVNWLKYSFKKCVVKVNRKEFNKIKSLEHIYSAYENTVLNGETSCIVCLPTTTELASNVLKFAKLWSP